MMTKRRIKMPCAYPGCTVKEARYGASRSAPHVSRTCAKHGRAIAIELTEPQAEWVDWALTGPIDEWGDPEQLAWDHDITIEEAKLAILARDLIELRRGPEWGGDNTLLLPSWAGEENAVIGALLNMLEDVAPDVARGYGYEDQLQMGRSPETADLVVSRKAACAMNAAEKIRKAIQ